MQDDIPAVSVALRRGDRLLLVLRGRAPSKGMWAFPGGRVEAGETDEDAAIREMFEETAIAIADPVFLRAWRLDPATQGAPAYRLHVFGATWTGGEPVAGDDAEDARFLTLAEMHALPVTRSVMEMARDILQSDILNGQLPAG